MYTHVVHTTVDDWQCNCLYDQRGLYMAPSVGGERIKSYIVFRIRTTGVQFRACRMHAYVENGRHDN